MFFRWRRKLKTWNFNRQIASIMDAPPLHVVDSGWSIVSMIASRDVPMYLLCIKAFYAHLGGGRVIGVIDRDMPQSVRDTLRRHVDGIELVVLEDINTGACQRGGTWERLVLLLERSEHQYIIQMDSDVLAVGPNLSEVRDCISRNVAFTMADGGRIMGMREVARRAQATADNHICKVAERYFDQYPDCDQLRYIAGSSGLAGFARGGFSRTRIEDFHRIMSDLLPSRWREWGSEQVASNFAVANSLGSVALPYPEYGSFWPNFDSGNCKCFHFIGSYRFHGGYFAKRGRAVIRELVNPVRA
jgi:hypothetical protein